jgi:hypothetical protein
MGSPPPHSDRSSHHDHHPAHHKAHAQHGHLTHHSHTHHDNKSKPKHSTHHHSYHAPAHPVLKAVHVEVHHADHPIVVPVPAQNMDEAHQVLAAIGQGTLGTGLHNTYLGHALPKIRAVYYAALESAEKEIVARQISLGPRLKDPAEFRKFVAWASEKRTSIARVYRVPAGLGGVVGGEIRDNLVYGPGGRTPENLVSRNMRRGLTEDAAWARVLTTVDRPNPAATEAILKGAKVLKGGGAVLFVGGAALSGYEIYKARPEDRPELIKKEAITTGGSILVSDLAVGVAFMVGMTGVGLIAVGIVAGVAGAYAAEQMYYAHQHSHPMQEFQHRGIIHTTELRTTPH